MDDSIIIGRMHDSYSAINSLVRPLKLTLQLNEIIKSNFLDKNNFFTSQQMKVIYENLDLLEDNSSIMTQAIQAIKSLLIDMKKNLKEFHINKTDSWKHKDLNKSDDNSFLELNYDYSQVEKLDFLLKRYSNTETNRINSINNIERNSDKTNNNQKISENNNQNNKCKRFF